MIMTMKVLEPISLDKTLLKIRNRDLKSENIAHSVCSWVQTGTDLENPIGQDNGKTKNQFDIDLLESDRIFHRKHIQELCVNYRLRFLSVKLFKYGLPEEALSAWEELEQLHQTSIEDLMIAAPSKSFYLKTYDDPILFAPMGNDYYYMIHKWGNDVSPLRRLKYWPVKNVVTFLLFCLAVSGLLTWITPVNKLGTTLLWAPFIVFLFMFKSIVGTVAYYFFMMGKNFNSEIWDRPFKEN